MTKRQKILIVDDKESNLVALGKTLQSIDADILRAHSGNEALAATLDHDFAVAILDVMMPEMNGYELADFLRNDKKTQAIPIIFLTAAHLDEQSIFKGYASGGVDYIIKPYSPELLLAKVRTFLELDRYKIHLEDMILKRTSELKKEKELLEESRENLRRNELYYRSIMYSMIEDIAVINRDHIIKDLNHNLIAAGGHSREDIIGKKCYTSLFGTQETCLGESNDCPVMEVMATAHPTTRRKTVLLENGGKAHIDVLFSPMKDEEGKTQNVIASMRNVTSLIAAYEALQQSERLLLEIQQLTKVGGWELDVDKKTVYCTREAYRIHSLEPEKCNPSAKEFLERILECYVPEDSSLLSEAIFRCKEKGVPYNLDLQLVAKNDKKLWIRTTAKPLWENGTITKIVGSVMDITRQKTMEEQFYQAQKMESIGQLAGGVAHDFNNLLTVILGNCELMKMSLSPDDPLAQTIEEVNQSGQRAAALTRQLLAFSRKQVMEPKILDINTLVSNLDKMLRRLIGEDIDYRTSLSPNIGKVKADPGQLEQVIVNLAVNARDAMPHGGKLTVETGNVFLDEAYGHTHMEVIPGEYIMIAVTDTGFGMDAKTKTKIFEPFFTTKGKGKGTGLGLATVFGIVKQSGGNIMCYSEPEKGTTMKIYLPVFKGMIDSPKQLNLTSFNKKGSETVLVAEDNDSVRTLIVRIARRAGHNVIEAENGDIALKACKNHQGIVDILITDIVMPGMDGKQLSDAVAKIYPEIKTLFISGYTDNAIVHHGVLDESANFLQKPFTSEQLIRKIREVLES